MLQITNLTRRYASKAAVNNVTLTIEPGKTYALLGPNGSGKTTLIKLCAGLLTANSGQITIGGVPVGPETKGIVSYLPDRTYLRNGQRVRQQLDYFQDFYADFDRARAEAMLADLHIDLNSRFGALSKGNKEKVQLVLVMSRRAKLYLLDEPIGGVDPAARDYILQTIITNYDPEAAVVISTHLIADVEQVLDHFVFVHQGQIVQSGSVDAAREATGLTIDELFREVFRCL